MPKNHSEILSEGWKITCLLSETPAKTFAVEVKLYLCTETCQCQHRFRTFQAKMKFCSFLEKNRRLHQIQRKNLCWVVGACTKEVSNSLKLGSYSIFYEILVNQSDRPVSRKDLHKIMKKFSICRLFWWNFICTGKMMNRVYITLYFRPNNNLLHFSQGINMNLTYFILKIRGT